MRKRASGPISTFRLHLKFSFSFSSLCLNLNETSDFEAVAKLLKVCQWVFAYELKDTLRLNKEVSGVHGILPANAANAAPACMCVCACEDDSESATQLKPAKGHHLHCSALNSASGQKQRRYPPCSPKSTQQQRWCVCVYVCVCRRRGGRGGGSTEVKK